MAAQRVFKNVADDSKATDAGQRYAKALFDLSNETNVLRAV